MTKKHSTKKALVASILALAMCFTMLVGTTFAWFTDSVASEGNVIQTGKLDVNLYWAEADEDPTAVSDWSTGKGAIFKNDKWEPGYTEAKHIKVANEGTLALKYQMRIIANGVVSELADVIDVYFFADAKQLDRNSVTGGEHLGTLAEVLNVKHATNISNKVSGSLEAGTSKTITLALKMQEDAGNEYQNMSIGTDFSIQILATQYTSEKDSFNENYDGGADFPPQETPSAAVFALSKEKLQGITIAGTNGATLDTGYSFQPTESFEQAAAGEFEWAHADFFVYADATVPANTMALAGYYSAFEGSNWGGETCTSTSWIGLTADVDIAAGEANGLRLLGNGMGMPGISYSEICQYGNDGIGFLCGAADLTGANEGTTLYVELRVYKIECQGTCGGHHNSFDCESGEYITIGKFQYTFDDADVVYLDDGSRVRYSDNGEVALEGVDKVTVTNGEYYVPDGVTSIASEIFGKNTDIKTVIIPDTVTDFGGTENADGTGASGGAFKKSTVEKIVLPEGMTEIPAAAFQQAANLTSINIPSTVKKIGINALAYIGITELTVPATVEEIGYGAFRGNTNLTTVTVEGDTKISNYAFRACPALTDIYLNGDDVTFTGNNMAFTLADSGQTTGMTLHCKNATVAASAVVAQNGTDYVNESWKLDLNGKTYSTAKVAKTSAHLADAISKTPEADAKFIVVADGTYADDINFTVATQGGQKGDLYIKAANDATATFSGTTTLGLYERGTTNVSEWEGAVIFDGITFDHASNGHHSIIVENVEYFEMRNCTVNGDGEYGIGSNSGCKAYNSRIIHCEFNNAAMQVLGNFGTGLVIDDCTFNDSRVNVQSGNGVTVQNSKFFATLTDANVDESFYLVRGSANGNGINVTVKNCQIEIDSTVTGIAASQAKWGALWNRGSVTPWTLENITITLTDAAVAQTELVPVKTAGAPMNCTNVTVNGVVQ